MTEVAIINNTELTSAQQRELDETADRIRTRDAAARDGWVETGRDLATAKALLKHGNFEHWCLNKLRYSKSTAERLMRAAEMISEWRKSGTVTLLPPLTLAYQLSAPSTPSCVRDDFKVRIAAGEKGLGRKLKCELQATGESADPALPSESSLVTSSSSSKDDLTHDETFPATMPEFDLLVRWSELPRLLELIAGREPRDRILSDAVVTELRRQLAVMPAFQKLVNPTSAGGDQFPADGDGAAEQALDVDYAVPSRADQQNQPDPTAAPPRPAAAVSKYDGTGKEVMPFLDLKKQRTQSGNHFRHS